MIATLHEEVIEDIDRDFIRMANASADGQPNRNGDAFPTEAVPPVTREQFIACVQQLRDNPLPPPAPSMLINRQLIDEIRAWGDGEWADEPDDVTVGVDMGHTELFNVSMVMTPADRSAYSNPDLGEEFPNEEFTEYTPVESMRTTVLMWFNDLCNGVMPWIAEAEARDHAIESVQEFTRRRLREDGFYRRILPPLQIANDELDRQADHVEESGRPQVFIEDSSDPRGFRIVGYHGTQPLPAAVAFIIKTAAFAVRVERLAKSLTEMIGWVTPITGLRESCLAGEFVQDALYRPNTLSSGQVDSEAP